MSNFIFSVVVCTYNRAALLASCLQGLSEQSLDKSLYEVIVVNNNSTDNTKDIVDDFASYSNFRVIVEMNQGLSHARNRGWQEASGEYVAYIDDDAIAFSDWVENMLEFIRRYPSVKAFGGPYYGYSIVEIPEWVPPGFGSHSLGEQERPIVMGKESISGSNMVFAKDLLQNVGGFRTDLGMSGNTISYGEETELVKRILNRGLDIYYLPSMKVKHLIQESKMSLSWMFRSAYANGRCSAKKFNKFRPLSRHFYNFLRALVASLNIFKPFPLIPFKRKVLFSFRPLFVSLGAMKEWCMIVLNKESVDI